MLSASVSIEATAPPNAMHLSISNEHFTPPDVVERSRVALGGVIDLDPASCAAANAIVRAHRFFSARGLEESWHGRTFCNPPGGKFPKGSEERKRVGPSVSAAWWRKLAREYAEGRVTSAIFIAFKLEILATTQGRDEGLQIPLDFPICYPRTRLDYLKPDEDGNLVPGGSPPHASAIVFLPPFEHGTRYRDLGSQYEFVAQFCSLGRCVTNKRVR